MNLWQIFSKNGQLYSLGMTQTCTVSQITRRRLGELVDVEVAATLLDLDGVGSESAALFLPVATHRAGDDAVSSPRVMPCQPQRGLGATFVDRDTPLRHLKTLTLIVESVPAFGRKKEIIIIIIIMRVNAFIQKVNYLSI